MATIKSYTDISQSKVLAKILPLESADMMYHSVENEYGSWAFVATSKVITNGLENDDFYIDDIPCWSLASLLGVLRGTSISTPDTLNKVRYSCWNDYDIIYADNPVDACVAMIEKLHELKML